MQITLQAEAGEIALSIGVIFILLFVSALISGSEVAYFSINRQQLNELEDSELDADKRIVSIILRAKELLATLLIANNLVNITIVILSYYLTFRQFDFSTFPVLGFVIQTFVVTFLIVMFGEVVPKVYATENNLKMARRMSGIVNFSMSLLKPMSWVLVQGTDLIDRRFKQYAQQVSIDELNQAIEMTYEEVPENPEEKDILKGIVNFGNISVKQVMVPRQDIKAIDIEQDFSELKAQVIEWGYSRVPVYKESLDHLEGILYLKDLLLKLDEPANYDWRSLLRKPFFVPEKKRIDDLFRDFQTKHTHMAIVVDEYGGCAGLITLEDVLEEIVGEINDEFDEVEESQLNQIDDRTFVCMGKISLQDLSKNVGFDMALFEEEMGEVDTLAGLILEIAGRIPEINEQISYHGYDFVVTEADARRIKTVQITIPGEDTPPIAEGAQSEI
ncbi:MAG: gliding motility-associated protein GldE [Sphingobacteriaceae bacterium]|nr:gliding motility-associated protein GldE [Sphingobacteriaceae bacterium]